MSTQSTLGTEYVDNEQYIASIEYSYQMYQPTIYAKRNTVELITGIE